MSKQVEIIKVDLPEFTDEQLEPLIIVLAEILAEEYLRKMGGANNAND